MFERFFISVSVISLMWVPLWAAAGESAWGWLDPLGRWLNLAILVGIVVYFAGKPISRYLGERRVSIQQQLREARVAREDAERKLDDIEERLKNLDQELAEMRAQADREAELERQRILEDAQKDAERVMAYVAREIEILTKTSRSGLRAYAAELMVDLAEARIGKEMNEVDENRISERFFHDLERRRQA